MEQTSRSISWEAPEYHYQKKGGDWYFVFAIIIVSLVIAALLLGSSLFALLLVVAGLVLAILAARKPSIVPYEVSVRGVRVDDELYTFSRLKSYHIDEDDPRGPQLLVLTKSHFMPLLVLPLPHGHIDNIEALLRSKIKEDVLEEPLMMKVLENFGF